MKIIRAEDAGQLRCWTGLLLFLLLAGIVVFILYPLVSLIGRSVFKNGMFTLEYYRLLFTRASLKLLKNSLWVASVSSVLTMTGAFFIALHLYTSSPKRTEKDGKLPASYHDLATLCVSAGVYHAVWKTGTDYLWPASYQRKSVRLAGYRDPSGDRKSVHLRRCFF